MNQTGFRYLYNNYKNNKLIKFNQNDWDKSINDWKIYLNIINQNSGLPIDCWLKDNNRSLPKDYLPNFLEKDWYFGHARITNYEHVMIYKNNKDGKFHDGYVSKCFDKQKDVENDYDTHIKPLLSKLINAQSSNDIYDIEKNDLEYNKFSSKHILRKIIVLMSLVSNSKWPHSFIWIYNEEPLKNLAKLFGIDYDDNKTFFQNNNEIYEKAKLFAGFNGCQNDEDYFYLYNLLWDLSDPSFNSADYIDFSNINVMISGAPGTGKTYEVTEKVKQLNIIDSDLYKESKYIQFHPSYTYQDFIEGIKPMGITSNGNIELRVVNGSFKQFCIDVKKENENYYKNKYVNKDTKPNEENPMNFKDWPHYYFIVDEINRGNISNIFGETFTLLEYRDYDFSGNYNQSKTNLVKTPLSNVIEKMGDNDLIYKEINGEDYFGIPFNIHFIGIMNDVDRSIDPFDIALRRRFKWVIKGCDYVVIHDILCGSGFDSDEVETYVVSCKNLNEFICGPSKDGANLGSIYEIGHSFFLKIKDLSNSKKIDKNIKEKIFDNYISGTLREYFKQLYDDNKIDEMINEAKKKFI